MTLVDVMCNWNETAIPVGVRSAAAPFRDARQLPGLNDPAGAWRRFAKAVRDWLAQATTHVCVVCGREVVRDRCHAFPQAGLERIRDFKANQAEDHIVGHTFEGLLKARVYGMGGTTSHQQFAGAERTARNINNLVNPEAPEALRCRIGSTFVAPLLCKDHEMQFSDWERSCYSGTEHDFWKVLPARAMFCLAYRAALRQLYLQHSFIRLLGEPAGDNLVWHRKRTIAGLQEAHSTFISAMNDKMPSINGLHQGHAVYAAVSETLLPFGGSGIFTYPRSDTRQEESYIGLLLPIELRVRNRTLLLLWQTRGTSSDLALDLVRTWTMSKRKGRDELLGLFFGAADQMFMSPQWWRSVPEQVRIDVTEHIHKSGPSRTDEKAIPLNDTVATLSGLWYFKHHRFYCAAYPDIREHRRGE